MNETLHAAAAAAGLNEPSREHLRLRLGLAFTERVAHLLEDSRATGALDVLRAYVEGRCTSSELEEMRLQVQSVARSHPGSKSLDGSAHAAVSATYAVANALAGRALDAASYAAYAAVYAYGGYAVSDPSAFEGEFEWQVRVFARLVGESTACREC